MGMTSSLSSLARALRSWPLVPPTACARLRRSRPDLQATTVAFADVLASAPPPSIGCSAALRDRHDHAGRDRRATAQLANPGDPAGLSIRPGRPAGWSDQEKVVGHWNVSVCPIASRESRPSALVAEPLVDRAPASPAPCLRRIGQTALPRNLSCRKGTTVGEGHLGPRILSAPSVLSEKYIA